MTTKHSATKKANGVEKKYPPDFFLGDNNSAPPPEEPTPQPEPKPEQPPLVYTAEQVLAFQKRAWRLGRAIGHCEEYIHNEARLQRAGRKVSRLRNALFASNDALALTTDALAD